MDIWEPTIGETLLAKMEPSNIKDRKAVAVIKDGETVGHVPLNLASKLFQERHQRGLRGGDWSKSEQRCWIWAGDSLHLSSVWPFYLH